MMMTIWNPWTYADYRKTVERMVTYGIKQLDFAIDGAIGYAHVELELRLDEFPSENVMAITALAIAAHQRGALSAYKNADDYSLYEELVQAYANGEHLVIANNLDSLQKQEFLRDVGIVSNVLGISLKQPA
jgi:hypothetical protein